MTDNMTCSNQKLECTSRSFGPTNKGTFNITVTDQKIRVGFGLTGFDLFNFLLKTTRGYIAPNIGGRSMVETTSTQVVIAANIFLHF